MYAMSMTDSTSAESYKSSDICKYKQCNKRVWNAEKIGRHEFCGRFHRELFVADFYDRLHPERRDEPPLQNPEQGQLCMLYGCRARRGIDPSTRLLFDFCGRSHFLEYTRKCTRQWSRENRLCQYNKCCRHVHVDEHSRRRPHKFCGMKHAVKAAAAESVLDAFGARDSPAETVDRRKTQIPISLQAGFLDEDSRGYQDKLDFRIMVESLQLAHQLASSSHDQRTSELRDGDLFRYFCVGVNIFDYHPWELFKEGKGLTRYFLHVGHDGNRLTTKEGFGYKQSSTPHQPKYPLKKRYLSYELKNKDPAGDSIGDHVRIYRTYPSKSNRWRLHEITLQSPEKSNAVIWKVQKNTKGGPVCCEDESSSPEDMQVESVSLDPMVSAVSKTDDELEDRPVYGEDESDPADFDQDMDQESLPVYQYSPRTQDGPNEFSSPEDVEDIIDNLSADSEEFIWKA